MNVFHSKAPGNYHGFSVPRVIGIVGHCRLWGGGEEYRTKKEDRYLRHGQTEFWFPELHPETGIRPASFTFIQHTFIKYLLGIMNCTPRI